MELSAYVILFLVTGMYLLTLFGVSWMKFFENGHYAWVEVSVLVAGVVLGMAFFIPKFWCRYFCPVGAIAEMSRVLFAWRRPNDKA